MRILLIVLALASAGSAGAVTIRLGAADTQADIVTAIWTALPERARFFEYHSNVIMVHEYRETIRLEVPSSATPEQRAALLNAIENIRVGTRTEKAPQSVLFNDARLEVTTAPDAVAAAPAANPVAPAGARRFTLRANPRWTAAECAVENVRDLRAFISDAAEGDEVIIEIDDTGIDVTRRAAVRGQFAVRLGNPLLGGWMMINGRTVRVIWPAARTPTYAAPDVEYPYHQTPSRLTALIDRELAGAPEEHYDFVIAPAAGSSLMGHARDVLARLEAEGALDRAGDVLRGDDLAVPERQRESVHLMFGIMFETLNEARPLHARKMLTWRSQRPSACPGLTLH